MHVAAGGVMAYRPAPVASSWVAASGARPATSSLSPSTAVPVQAPAVTLAGGPYQGLPTKNYSSGVAALSQRPLQQRTSPAFVVNTGASICRPSPSAQSTSGNACSASSTGSVSLQPVARAAAPSTCSESSSTTWACGPGTDFESLADYFPPCDSSWAEPYRSMLELLSAKGLLDALPTDSNGVLHVGLPFCGSMQECPVPQLAEALRRHCLPQHITLKTATLL
eukprot:TRINITY_DN55461_c0_g1_i1.p1 TRINITY_DN55461_c0_g1~~TRINITY_DN55461_c0_g1_i1.p1  ORF type:complete len:224 (+),score=20.61 TRINITY_DN55461_c0_g1_i1:93-764(+)